MIRYTYFSLFICKMKKKKKNEKATYAKMKKEEKRKSNICSKYRPFFFVFPSIMENRKWQSSFLFCN